jgi:hypothetical protein
MFPVDLEDFPLTWQLRGMVQPPFVGVLAQLERRVEPIALAQNRRRWQF